MTGTDRPRDSIAGSDLDSVTCVISQSQRAQRLNSQREDERKKAERINHVGVIMGQ